jgi:predicted dehydrogenase
MQAAEEHQVVTQLGNQGHSSDSIRTFCEWIWDGAIGRVHTIHAGCRAVNSASMPCRVSSEQHAVPEHLDWDLWLGPALQRPYHPAYLPGAWRGWVPFGNGTIGDWVCHVVDPVFWALDLGLPTTILAEVNDYDPKTQGDAFPKGDKVTFEFPARGDRGPVTMVWHSGTNPSRGPTTWKRTASRSKRARTSSATRHDHVRLPRRRRGADHPRSQDAAVPAAGEDHSAHPRPPARLARRDPRGNQGRFGFLLRRTPDRDRHAGRDRPEAAGIKLQWDAQQMRFTNCDEANQYVNPPYREGWTL